MDTNFYYNETKDNLSSCILVAVIFHLFLIFGLSFINEKSNAASSSLDVTIATLEKAEKVKNADFIAQQNQEGSGSLEEKALVKTTKEAIFQDSQTNDAEIPQEQTTPDFQSISYNVIISEKSFETTDLDENDEQETLEEIQPLNDLLDANYSEYIASLEARIAMQQQEYAKRPKVLRMNSASAMQDITAIYKDEWRKKIEYLGNKHYPQEAKQQALYGSVQVFVLIEKNGNLHKVEISKSSGIDILDKAALQIVNMAAPFEAFTEELQQFDQLEIVRTLKFEKIGLASE